MKNLYFLWLFFFNVIHLDAQNCNIGNQTQDGSFTLTGTFLKNNLVGIKFTLANPGILNSFNLIGNNTGSLVQMALYDDNNNFPNNLVATSEVGTVTAGVVTLSTVAKNLAAGDYWIMTVYNKDGAHSNFASRPIKVSYTILSFGNAMPPNASSFMWYTGQDFLYFLGITCSTLMNADLENGQKSVLYPNPTSDYIFLSSKNSNESYVIYDTTGKSILSGTVEKNQKIKVQNLAAGIYILKLPQSGETIQFLKK